MFGAFTAWRMAGTVLLIILAFFGCSLVSMVSGHELTEGYNDHFVPMVDPSGLNPERDLTFSQANLNNSEANLNNAEAAKSLAQATAIIQQSTYDDPLYVHKEITSETNSAFVNGMLYVVGAIFVFVVLFVTLGMLGGGKNGSSTK
jgi:hypothetical protein